MRVLLVVVVSVCLCLGEIWIDAGSDLYGGSYVAQNPNMQPGINSSTTASDFDAFDLYVQEEVVPFIVPPTISQSGSWIPPFESSNSYNVKYLSICPGGDVDKMQIFSGEHLPGIYKIKFSSSQFNYGTQNKAQGGLEVIESWTSKTAVRGERWVTSSGGITDIDHYVISGGKNRNNITYTVGPNATTGIKWKGDYSVHVNYVEACPANIFFGAGGWPKPLQQNSTYLINGFLCNGVPQTGLNSAAPPPFPSEDIFEIQLRNQDQGLVTQQITVVRLPGSRFIVPDLEQFSLSYEIEDYQVQSRNWTQSTFYTVVTPVNSTTVPKRIRFRARMNITSGRDSPGSEHLYPPVNNWYAANSTFPAGYIGYKAIVETCTQDRYEPIPGTPSYDLVALSDYGFNITETRMNFTVTDLTECPSLGYDQDPKFTRNDYEPMPDPDNYKIDVAVDIPGFLNITVHSDQVCLTPWLENQPNPQEGSTTFPQYLRYRNNAGDYAASVIAGWNEYYNISVRFCNSSSTPGTAAQPLNLYDWFRNFTSIPQYSYTLKAEFNRYCPASSLSSNNQNTSAFVLPFQSGSWLSWTTTGLQWLCRDNYPTGSTGRQQQWYKFTTGSRNYTYATISLYGSWFVDPVQYNNWPDFNLTFWRGGSSGLTQIVTTQIPRTQAQYSFNKIPLIQPSSTQGENDYYVSVSLVAPNNFTIYPFNNFYVSISVVDCNGEAEPHDPIQIITPNAVIPNKGTDQVTYGICAVTDAYTPTSDVDKYNFTVAGFPGFVTATVVSADSTWGGKNPELHWLDTNNGTIINLPSQTSGGSTNTYNSLKLITQETADLFVQVDSSQLYGGYGMYTLSVSLDQTCPLAFSTNVSTTAGAKTIPTGVNAYWVMSANVDNKATPFVSGSFVGPTVAPWGCANPQLFKFVPQANVAMKYRYSLSRTLDYAPIASTFETTLSNSTVTLGTQNSQANQGLANQVEINGTTTDPLFLNVTFSSPKDVWVAYDLMVATCNADIYDNYTDNEVVPLWMWYGQPIDAQTPLPRRINSTVSSGVVSGLRLCFKNDDVDKYAIFLDDWAEKGGFLKVVAKGQLDAINVTFLNSTALNCFPKVVQTDATTYTTTHYSYIASSTNSYYGVQASSYEYNPTTVWTDYTLEFSFSRKCPLPLWGDNGQLSTALVIPSPPCNVDNYQWSTGCQFLCDDYESVPLTYGDKSHYYIIQNTQPQNIMLMATLSSTSFDPTPNNCQWGQGPAKWATFRLTLWQNGVHSKYLYLDGCSTNVTNPGEIDFILPMGTHFIEVTLLRNSTVNTENFYRDYNLNLQMSYCDCNDNPTGDSFTVFLSQNSPDFTGDFINQFTSKFNIDPTSLTGTSFGTNSSGTRYFTSTGTNKFASSDYRTQFFAQLSSSFANGKTLAIGSWVLVVYTGPTPSLPTPSNTWKLGLGATGPLYLSARPTAFGQMVSENPDMGAANVTATGWTIDMFDLMWTDSQDGKNLILSPPFIGSTESTAHKFTDIGICLRNDTDSFNIRVGEYTPGFYEIRFTSNDWVQSQTAAYTGIYVLQKPNSTSAVDRGEVFWNPSANTAPEYKFRVLSGGKDENFMDYDIASIVSPNGQTYSRGLYGIDIRYVEVCPSSIFYQSGWPFALRTNNTHFGVGILCNGLQQLTPAPPGPNYSYNDTFRTELTSSQTNARVLSVFRVNQLYTAPSREGFYASLYVNNETGPFWFTSSYNNVQEETVSPGTPKYVNWTVTMNVTTPSGPSLVNSSLPKGYVGYGFMIETCTLDYLEQSPGNRDQNTQINPVNFTSPTSSYHQLTLCPFYGYSLQGPEFFGDKDWYEFTATNTDTAGLLTVQVQPSSSQTPAICLTSEIIVSNPSDANGGGPSAFSWWQNLTSANLGYAQALVGWNQVYYAKVNLCPQFAIPSSWMGYAPLTSDYQYFRNYTSVPTYSYTFSTQLTKKCQITPNNVTGNFSPQTAKSFPFAAKVFKGKQVFTSGLNWLCRTDYDNGQPEQWYTFTTQLNYTYFDATLSGSWFVDPQNNFKNWPRLRMTVYTNNQTSGNVTLADVVQTDATQSILVASRYPYLMEPAQQYWIRVRIDDPQLTFPLNNYILTVTLYDCSLDKYENDDYFEKAGNLTSQAALLSGQQTTITSLSICGLDASNTPQLSSSPRLDQDFYKFNFNSGSPSLSNFPGLVSVSWQVDTINGYWPEQNSDLQLTWIQNASGSELPIGTTPTDTIYVPSSAANEVRLIAENVDNLNLLVRVTNAGNISDSYGGYSLTLKYAEQCPRAFPNNITVQPYQVPSKQIWSIAANAPDTSFGASFIGPATLPHQCWNSQNFSIPLDNNTKLSVSYNVVYDWRPTPYQMNFRLYEQGSSSDFQNLDLYNAGSPTYTVDTINKGPQTWLSSLLLTETNPETKRWIGYNLVFNSCPVDRYDAVASQQPDDIRVYLESGADTPYPRRINETTTATITQTTLCYTNDVDKYTVYLEDWASNEGFITMVVTSTGKPVNITPGTELLNITMVGLPCQNCSVSQNNGVYTTTYIAQVNGTYQKYYSFEVTGSNWNIPTNKDYIDVQSATFSYSRKCPAPYYPAAVGDISQLSTAYNLQPADCWAPREWNLTCGYLCGHYNPEVGGRSNFFVVKNTLHQFMVSRFELSSKSFSPAPSCLDQSTPWATIRMTVYINEFQSANTMMVELDGCSSQTSLSVTLPMGTHYVQIELLRYRDNEIPYQNLFRDYSLFTRFEYCDCDAISQEAWNINTLTFTRTDGVTTMTAQDNYRFITALMNDTLYQDNKNFWNPQVFSFVSNPTFSSGSFTVPLRIAHVTEDLRSNTINTYLQQLAAKTRKSTALTAAGFSLTQVFIPVPPTPAPSPVPPSPNPEPTPEPAPTPVPEPPSSGTTITPGSAGASTTVSKEADIFDEFNRKVGRIIWNDKTKFPSTDTIISWKTPSADILSRARNANILSPIIDFSLVDANGNNLDPSGNFDLGSVTICLYSSPGVSPCLAFYTDSSQKWTCEDSNLAPWNETSHEYCGNTNHFTPFAIMETATTAGPTGPPSSSGDSGLPAWAIVLIVIAVLVFVAIIFIVIIAVVMKSKSGINDKHTAMREPMV